MSTINCENLPFVVDVCGLFPPGRVQVTFSPESRPTTPELEAAIAAQWRRQTDSARGTDRMLFNGELLRYLRHDVVDDPAGASFRLTVGPTCYRDFVGTNLFNRHRVDHFGWERFANPVGTTATLLTSDGRLCFGRRSQRVSYHAGHVHTFGGALEMTDRLPDGRIDAFASVSRELAEELDLSPPDLADIRCVGLIRDREIHQPEMLFETRIAMTADELRRRWRSAAARDEHDEVVTLDNRPDAVVPFIRSCPKIAPVAVGALFLHGRLTWGPSWFDQARNDWCPDHVG